MKKAISIIFVSIFILIQLFVGVYYNPIIYIEKDLNEFNIFIKKHNFSHFDKILYEKKDDKYYYFIHKNGFFTNFNYIDFHKFKIDRSLIEIKNIKKGDYLSDFCSECSKNIIKME